MKLLRKALCLLLATMMVALTLLACGDDGETATSGGTQTSGKPDAVSSGNLPQDGDDTPNIPSELYFDDHPEIRFIVTNGDSNSGEELPARSIDIDEDADMGYDVNKAVNDRNNKVEEQLGVSIVLKQVVDMSHLSETLQPILLSGLDEYDVVSGFEYYDIGITLDSSTSGTFLNYNAIPEDEMYIDVTKPYWDDDLYNELAYNGAAYWISGDLSQAWVGSIYVSFVNKRIWELYAEQIKQMTGSSDIYKIVEDGKWTLDLWCELSRMAYVDSNANEMVDEGDQVGYMTYKPNLGSIMSDGLAGGSHVTYTKWEDGVPQVDFFNDHNTEFAGKLYRLYYESNALLIDGAVAEQYLLTTWAEGKSLFTVNLLSNSELYLNDMNDDYYIVPVPKLNEDQAEYTTVNHDSISLYGIPASCEHVAATTATLELMAYYSYKLVTPAYYDVALKERYSRDPKTAEMVDQIRESLYSDFVALWAEECGGCTHFLRTNINKHFASEARTKQRTWQRQLEKLLEKIENSAFLE